MHVIAYLFINITVYENADLFFLVYVRVLV